MAAASAFVSNRTGKPGLYVKPSSGTGQEELLYESPDYKGDTSWSRDGRFVLLAQVDVKTSTDVWVLPNPLGDPAARKPFAFVATTAAEVEPNLSPDGKYLAYASNENNLFQVYVQSFPGKQGKFQVSTNGGARPVWSRDGKELFYTSSDGKMMAVDVKTGATFEHSLPKPLFDTHVLPNTRFDVSADGKRFLLVPNSGDAATSLMVTLNWQAARK